MKNVITVGRGRNQGISLESGGFSDQFYESAACMKETKVVCINCEQLQSFITCQVWIVVVGGCQQY